MPIDNKGILAQVNILPDGVGGRFGISTFLFSSGFLVSGYNSDSLWTCGQATSSLVENFLPGNVDSNQADPIYKIYVNDNSSTPNYSDWQDYTNAVRTGASFYDGNGDGTYNPVDLNGNNQWDPNEDKPDIIGDKTTWCVYNDGMPGDQRIKFAGINPVGLEIRQSLFGYATIGLLGNVIFIRYELLNTGKVNQNLDSVYFSIWSDPDIGADYMDDLAGCDTLKQAGFVYNFDNNDPGGYGNEPPAFFIQLLEGPRSYIPGITFIDNNLNGTFENGIDIPLDTAYSRKGKYLGIERFLGAKNQSISSFVHFICCDPHRYDPQTSVEARNYMLGKLRIGSTLNPCEPDLLSGVFGGINCNTINPDFWYSGDPVANVGWLYTSETDQRIMLNTGPFQLEVGKPVSMIFAYIVGQGVDRLESITKAREIAEYTHNFYLSNFGEFPVNVDEYPLAQLPAEFNLEQNFPNPFNSTTKISWQSPIAGQQTLKVFDILGNEVATLVNEYRNPGSYEVGFDASTLSSGVYFYKLQAGTFAQTKKMILIK